MLKDNQSLTGGGFGALWEPCCKGWGSIPNGFATIHSTDCPELRRQAIAWASATMAKAVVDAVPWVLMVMLSETIADAIEAMNGQARDCGCWERIKADFMKDRA